MVRNTGGGTGTAAVPDDAGAVGLSMIGLPFDLRKRELPAASPLAGGRPQAAQLSCVGASELVPIIRAYSASATDLPGQVGEGYPCEPRRLVVSGGLGGEVVAALGLVGG